MTSDPAKAGAPSTSGETRDLIHDWNEVARRGRIIPRGVEFFDETLRDGLQNPSVSDPHIDQKLQLLHLMAKLGIHAADIGLPGSSQRAFEDVRQRLADDGRVRAL